MDFLQKQVEMFRKEKLFCIWAAHKPFVFLIKAEAVKELLKNNKMNDKSWMYEWLKPLLGSGVITSSYDKSKAKRKALLPCFFSDMLSSFMPIFNKEARKLVKFLEKETNKDFTYIAEPILLCAMDITCETIFGVTVNALKSENLEIAKSFSRTSDIFISKTISPWKWLHKIYRYTKMGKQSQNYLDFLQRTTDMIAEKKKLYLRGEEEVIQRPKSMMELLLDHRQLSEKEIDEEMGTFALVGHINTAVTARWAMFLIGLYPNVQARLHDEIDQIFGNDLGRPITEKDIRQLKYLDCVLKETSRLFPSVSVFARQATEETQVCGYTIPEGSSCIVFTYFLHRDPDVFPEPEKFDPDRFLPENRINIPEYAYIPFSAGPRGCLGYKFADMELKTIVSQILRNFSVQSLDGRDEIKPVLTPTLHPNVPIRIKIKSRSKRDSIYEQLDCLD